MISIFASGVMLCGCELISFDTDKDTNKDEDSNDAPEAVEYDSPNHPVSISDEGVKYMWNPGFIPEITVQITEEEWNRLLARYDEFDQNVDYFHADFIYKRGGPTQRNFDD